SRKTSWRSLSKRPPWPGFRSRGRTGSPAGTGRTDAPLRLAGVGQLLQGAAAPRPSGDAVRAPGAQRRRPLEPEGATRPSQPGIARTDARVRRRPSPWRVGGDPLVSRRRHAIRAERALGPGEGVAVDVLRAVQPRAERRGRALLAARARRRSERRGAR